MGQQWCPPCTIFESGPLGGAFVPRFHRRGRRGRTPKLRAVPRPAAPCRRRPPTRARTWAPPACGPLRSIRPIRSHSSRNHSCVAVGRGWRASCSLAPTRRPAGGRPHTFGFGAPRRLRPTAVLGPPRTHALICPRQQRAPAGRCPCSSAHGMLCVCLQAASPLDVPSFWPRTQELLVLMELSTHKPQQRGACPLDRGGAGLPAQEGLPFVICPPVIRPSCAPSAKAPACRGVLSRRTRRVARVRAPSDNIHTHPMSEMKREERLLGVFLGV